MSTLYTKISKELDQTIEQLAKERGMKKADLVRELLQDGFKADQVVSKGETMKEKALEVEKVKDDISGIRDKIEALKDLPSCVQTLDKCLSEDMQLVTEWMEKLTARFEDFQKDRLEIEKKFKILTNFIENHIDLFVKGMGANVCADDIIGLAVLRGKEIPSTKGLDKHQLKDLFHRMMETKPAGE